VNAEANVLKLFGHYMINLDSIIDIRFEANILKPLQIEVFGASLF